MIYDVQKLTLTIPDGLKTSGLVNIPAQCNGQLLSIESIAPNLDTDATFVLALQTPDGSNLIGALGDAIADNSTVLTQIIDTLRRCLSGQEKVQVSCATNQTGDKEIELILGISSAGM